MTTRDDEPMLDLVGRDVGMSRHLSKALKVLVDSPGIDNDLRKQLREIMNGRGSLRDLAHNESFTRLSEATLPKVIADIASRTPEQMQQLARAGEQILDTYRNQIPDTSSAADSTPESATPGARTNTSTTPAEPTAGSANGNGPVVPRNVIPGTRKPDREQIVTPDEPDDDDRYYRDRRRSGWLE
ncbi:hypothetical protein [Nocardia arizonensis]|uniref:hypothetical protein n=1 Tax=Nocardia arizonensis TaxID=1141647 RepID=UPI0006D1611E|nr:hypothetical protein [Nocardia arizonensis]